MLAARRAMRFPNPFEAFMAGCRIIRAKFSRQAVILDEASVDSRLRACEKCPEFDASTRQCNACTCMVDLKAQLATEKCPRGRWSVTNR